MAKSVKEVSVLTGIVKFFVESKGYGFIIPDEAIDDVFFHQTNASSPLTKGDRVVFELEDTKRGPKAINVHKA